MLLIPMGGLEARLVHLQLLTTTETTYDLAMKRQSVEIVRPKRGEILDTTYAESFKSIQVW